MSDFKIGDDGRRRTTDQLQALRRANDDRVAWDTEAPADFTYLYDPDHVLVRVRDVEEFEAALGRLEGIFDGNAERGEDPVPGELARYRLPARAKNETVPDILDLLDLDERFGPGRVTPDHWIHITPGGCTCCPATEPEETGLVEPWPPVCTDHGRGKGVSVVVVDTGWNPPSATDNRTPWLKRVDGDDELNGPDLREYAGHGTFIAGVVRCLAPATRVFVEGFAVGGVGGGGILESAMVTQLTEALTHKPQVINLSAGLRTRDDLPPLSFEVFYETQLQGLDCVLVAAAGNDTSPAPFWPAAFEWALGVGALDRDGRVSDFSNYGVSTDVYALGRNIVNAFPDGTYTCFETPHKGDVRVFDSGMARWSGTSFAAPIVAGLVAAEISAAGCSAHEARDTVVARAVRMSDPTIGPIEALRQPYC
ncbi:S8/S53 family peptidase [Nocardioides sp. InS609-2]|uniref:S8 family peptidase n=1 Tax=Nocardioides sp. InS609-2 TaxID=2760705 RepID=UPI0020BF3FFF|nr:S8/S53 family peptidase [Nocardioides sp. InS609-2]